MLYTSALALAAFASPSPAAAAEHKSRDGKTMAVAKSAKRSMRRPNGTLRSSASRHPAAVRAASVVPDQHGKVVLFAFRDDEGEAISRLVTQLLQAHGVMVITGVRRVDTSEQYRDMATHLGLVAYVDGDVRGTDNKTRVSVRIRSGYTGRALSQAAFVAARAEIPRNLGDNLWPKVGRAFAHACKDAEKPRKRGRTLQIDAGTPIETRPAAAAAAARPPAID